MKTGLVTLILLMTVSNYGISQEQLILNKEKPLKSDYKIILYKAPNPNWMFTTVEEYYEEFNSRGKPQLIINSSKDSIIGILKGITYETPLNSPVYATDNGVVSEIKFLEEKYEGRKGVSLRIRHKKGLESEYVEIDNIVVKYGEKVVKDQIIGYTANKEFFFQFVNNGKPMDPPSYFFEQQKSIIKTY